MSVLEVKGVGYYYFSDKPVLRDICLSFEKGNQFITQLQETYPDDWQHIAFACENIVGFRCSDPVTANFISEYSNHHKNSEGSAAQDGYATRTLKEDKGYPNCMNLPINKLIVLSRAKTIALYDRDVFRSITEKQI